MILRRLLVLSFVAITGCAVMANDPGWETTPAHAPLPAYFIDTTAVKLQQLCPPKYRDWITHGCAVRNYALGKCFIYVEAGAPKWLAYHEALHCAGFSHED